MALAAGRDRKRPAEVHRPAAVVDEELKRTLERDTAVQGEREEDAVRTPRSPAGGGSAPAVRPDGGKSRPK